MGVANESGDARGVANNRPAVFVQLHAYENVTGDANTRDKLALAVLDLNDVFHRYFDLENEVLHGHRNLAVLDVLLDALLEAGIGVDDVPLARQRLQVGAELGVRVDFGRLGRLVVDFPGRDFPGGTLTGTLGERLVNDGIRFRVCNGRGIQCILDASHRVTTVDGAHGEFLCRLHIGHLVGEHRTFQRLVLF